MTRKRDRRKRTMTREEFVQRASEGNIDKNTSFVGFVFNGVGSAEGVFAQQNVSPGQIKLAGHMLIKIGDRMLDMAWEENERRLADEKEDEKKPKPGIIRLDDKISVL